MSVKKILFIGWYPNNVEKYRNVFFRNLIYAIADKGIDCTVISPVSYVRYRRKIAFIPKEEYQLTPNGNKVRVYYPRVLSASSKQIVFFNTEIITEKWFEDGAIRQAKALTGYGEQFDAVYGHFFLYGGLAAIKIGRLLEIPSFVAFGECDYETQIQERFGDLKPKHIKGLSGVISVSTKNANRLKELGIFDDVPIIVAPNGVDQSLFKKMNRELCRKELGLPNDKFIVGFVGGFIERKGDKRLLEAVSQLKDVFLAFAGVPGAGQTKPSGDRVLFCKPLKHEMIPVLLNAVDAFCLPTLSEGSCNAVVEALACGIPVISSDLSFNDDVLTDDNSIRIDPTSVDEIRDGIKMLLDNTELRKRYETAGYQTALDLSIDKRADKIMAFIEDNLEKKK